MVAIPDPRRGRAASVGVLRTGRDGQVTPSRLSGKSQSNPKIANLSVPSATLDGFFEGLSPDRARAEPMATNAGWIVRGQFRPPRRIYVGRVQYRLGSCHASPRPVDQRNPDRALQCSGTAWSNAANAPAG